MKVIAGAVVTVEELVNGSRVVTVVGQDVDVGGILRFRVWGLGFDLLHSIVSEGLKDLLVVARPRIRS